MIWPTKGIKTSLVTATFLLSFVLPASSQGLTHMSKRDSAPPVQNQPKVDEKAYKAALERIPEPGKQYDPWGYGAPGRAQVREKIELAEVTD